MQNGTLAIAVASSTIFLNNSTMAIPAGIYSLLIYYFTYTVFGWWLANRTVDIAS